MAESQTPKRKGPTRREPRYRCLYPGLLRVLFPERSFVPLSLAVRTVNLSSGGAMVVLHQANLADPVEALLGRYVELRIAAAGATPLYGRIARLDARAVDPVFGLRFHASHPELVGQLIHGDTAEIDENTTLPLPILDPHSPLSGTAQIRLTGRALGAAAIHVANDFGATSEFPVVEGRFELVLQLLSEGENAFQMTTRNGDQRSLPLTVTVAYLPTARDELFFRCEPTLDASGKEVVDLEFLGTGAAARRILGAWGEALDESARVRFQARAVSSPRLGGEVLNELRRLANELREREP
jgi:hypothetical protein